MCLLRAESFHSPNIASAVTQHPELVPSSSVKFVLPLLIKLSKKGSLELSKSKVHVSTSVILADAENFQIHVP